MEMARRERTVNPNGVSAAFPPRGLLSCAGSSRCARSSCSGCRAWRCCDQGIMATLALPPPVASLLFVKHRVVDSLALTVFSSIGGDPRCARDGLAALLLHDF